MPRSPEDWLVEIDNALEYRREYGREARWDSLEKSFLNDPDSDTAIGPNLVFSMGDSLLSSLTVPDPEISVIPEHPNGVDRAPMVEQVDNYLLRKLRVKRAVELAAEHCYLNGKGIIKIGYDSEFGWAPKFDIGRNQSAGLTLTQFDRKGKRIEYMNTIPGMPWLSVVQPRDFVVPYGTIFLDNAPWCAHRIIRETAYFKSDKKYSNTSRLEPKLSMEDYMAEYFKVRKDRMKFHHDDTMYANRKPRFTVAWEIHDRMTGKVYVVADDYDKFLRNDFNALLVAGLPFVDLGFVTHPRSFWSTPQAYYLGQIQHIQFDIALQGEKQRRLNHFKVLIRKGIMSEEQMKAVLSADSGPFVQVDSSEPMKDLMVTVPQGNLLEYYLQATNNKRDAREAIGQSQNQAGEYDSSSRRTAREATFVQQGSDRRAGKKASAISTMYLEIMEKVNKIVFNFWKLPRYIMTDKDWVKFTGEELKGDYLYDLSLSTKRNLSRAERKVEAMMMMSQFAQIPGIDYSSLFKYLQDAVNDPAFERILAPVVGKGGQGALPSRQGGLPTIPATGGQS